ncbi:hypothetical protein HOY82DRAFT_565697, partial [Tuber indicum]
SWTLRGILPALPLFRAIRVCWSTYPPFAFCLLFPVPPFCSPCSTLSTTGPFSYPWVPSSAACLLPYDRLVSPLFILSRLHVPAYVSVCALV